jgi:hypothetical protein
MTRYVPIKQTQALSAYLSGTGAPVPAVLDPTNGFGLTLGVGTYLFPLGGERYGSVVETVMHSFSAKWPAGIVGTLTIEGTNFPKTQTGADQGPNDITDWDATDAWQQLNPALTGMVLATANGTGTMTNWSCAITAGAGGALWNIPDLGVMRLRLKAVLSTGGFLRVTGHGKLGS